LKNNAFFRLFRNIVQFIRTNVYESIRLQLVLTFVICFIASLFVGSLSTQYFEKINRTPFIDYSSGISYIDSKAREILNQLGHPDSISPYPHPGIGFSEENEHSLTEEQRIVQMIEQEGRWDANLKILILDLDGKVLYKSAGATETHVDLHGIIRNAMEYRWKDIHPDNAYSGKEYYSFYPVDLEIGKAYLVVSAIPSPNIIFRYGGNEMASLLFAFATFIFIFYWLTKNKTKYIEELAQGLLEISKGNLHFRVNKKSNDELGTLATNINYMAEQLHKKNEEERLAEKTKNELITNVSHDLRTPLTLIMGYLRLLKDKNYESEQQSDHYLNIAFSKADKLKLLIDDLFEYTKLSNEDVKLVQERVCINELLEQLLEEVVTYTEENDLTIQKALTQEKLYVVVDPDKLIRVFENLLTNAVKYSVKPGRIKVLMYRELEHVKVCVINQGEPISQEDIQRVFDRFYKVDSSRSSESGGSGLGLAIAKSIVEYHQGEIWAESEGEEIRFWVKLHLA
jgi:signal transduction histidine kinase